MSLCGCVLRRLSEAEKSEIWDRFEGGESQRSISRRLGRSPSSIRTHLLAAGVPETFAAGDWVSLRLSLTEREEISRGLAAGESLRGIAAGLGRAASTGLALDVPGSPFGVVFVTICWPVEPSVVVWLVRGERRRQPVVVIRSAHRGYPR